MAFCHHFQDCMLLALMQNGNAICHVMKYYNAVGLHYNITKVTTLWLMLFLQCTFDLVHATNCLPNKICTMTCPCNSIVRTNLFPEIRKSHRQFGYTNY